MDVRIVEDWHDELRVELNKVQDKNPNAWQALGHIGTLAIIAAQLVEQLEV